MPSGLVALLDDIAGITKLAAASLDDVGAAATKAGAKAAGVVIDDAAVTPRYVTDFQPDRELPIIAKIAVGSLRNKLLVLLPLALLLSAFAPWAITPLLMIGGAFLCFEGAEKLMEALAGEHQEADVPMFEEPAEMEAAKVSGAIRTDFILSAEIMAIALASVETEPLWEQGVILAVVGIAITVAVYGVVGFIVKMDDIGLNLAKRGTAAVRALGRALVKGMPIVMNVLGVVGTAAMLWVGGQIVIHGMHELGVAEPDSTIHHLSVSAASAAGDTIGPVVGWLIAAGLSGLFGALLGAIIAMAVHKISAWRKGKAIAA